MSKVIVRGSRPGVFRVELEGSEGTGVEVDSSLTAYQAAHELQPFMQALLDAVPEPVVVPRKSKAPPAGDA